MTTDQAKTLSYAAVVFFAFIVLLFPIGIAVNMSRKKIKILTLFLLLCGGVLGLISGALYWWQHFTRS